MLWALPCVRTSQRGRNALPTPPPNTRLAAAHIFSFSLYSTYHSLKLYCLLVHYFIFYSSRIGAPWGQDFCQLCSLLYPQLGTSLGKGYEGLFSTSYNSPQANNACPALRIFYWPQRLKVGLGPGTQGHHCWQRSWAQVGPKVQGVPRSMQGSH